MGGKWSLAGQFVLQFLKNRPQRLVSGGDALLTGGDRISKEQGRLVAGRVRRQMEGNTNIVKRRVAEIRVPVARFYNQDFAGTQTVLEAIQLKMITSADHGHNLEWPAVGVFVFAQAWTSLWQVAEWMPVENAALRARNRNRPHE